MKIVRRVDEYAREGSVAWFGEMPQAAGCSSPLWGELGEGKDGVWLEVRKQVLPVRPGLPELLKPWVDLDRLDRSEGEEPELREVAYLEIDGAGADDSARQEPLLAAERLENHPEVVESWHRYLERWRPWKGEHSRLAAVQKLYGELFHAYQAQRRLGEAYEFVVGIGLLVWTTPQGHSVRRHVVVAQAELKFDQKRGVLSVECPPPPDGARLQIEDDFLEVSERPAGEFYKAAQEQLREIGDAIWERGEVEALLTAWATSIHPDAIYDPALAPPRRSCQELTITYSPALILRRRTARGILGAYEKIIGQLEKGGAIPFGLQRLVGHLDDEGVVSGPLPREGGGGPAAQETYFPLPANDEQRRIVGELDRRQGVLVQGPPGTGKSQTIANLICHFLAGGKRVLVTSETGRALKVLKDKIPVEVRPLCVSLLGADTASFTELEASISGISRRHAHWSPQRYEQEIAGLEGDVDAGRRRKAEVDRALRELRESETYVVSLAGGSYRGTAAAIGQQIANERARFGWLSLPDGAPSDPPVTGEEALELFRALHLLHPEKVEELSRPLVSLEDLPWPDELMALVRAEHTARELAETFADLRSESAFEPLLRSASHRRQAIRGLLDDLLDRKRRLEARPEAWIRGALSNILAGSTAPWKVLLQRTREGLDGLRDLARVGDSHRVTLTEGLDPKSVLADARAMQEHLAAGGRWGLLGLPSRTARGRTYLRKKVALDGKPPESREALTAVIRVLEVRERLTQLWTVWSKHARAGDAVLETQVAELEEHLEALEHCFALLELVHPLNNELARDPRIAEPDWRSAGERLQRVLDAVEASIAEKRARSTTEAALERLQEVCAHHDAHQLNYELLGALRTRDHPRWSGAHSRLRSAHSDLIALRRAEDLLEQLRRAAPEFSKHLAEAAQAEHWEGKLADFERAWAWAATERWLRQRDDEGHYRSLVREAHRLESHLGRLVAKLAAEKAWAKFLSRLSQAESESLHAWQVAVKRIGKGTGKHAERYRQEARKYMAGCVKSIPAWIVPRYRAAEVLEPQPDLFDVVIIDEASQTGIDGLFLYYLGRQMVVVGDDHQISPYGVGAPEEAIQELQRRFLDDIPNPIALTQKSSLYDHAKIRYRGTIVLQEHFRCMPEIIQFSNDLCYAPAGAPLIPLKTYPPDRLSPVVTRFVADGYQTGAASSAVNRPEAESLVSQVKECLRDPRYSNKSFGVISLLGGDQARLMQQLLFQGVSPEQLEARDLISGDAYAFQGDERDVIFLSMVSAPNATIGALTEAAAVRRFNVAASRAKDQLWLFHSVKPEDLSAACVRRRLLEYCLNPAREPLSGTDDDFESGFERHMCQMIRARGYHVRVQVPAGDQGSHRYRIDLVVEGMKGRLAVECDGDSWHGPDHYEKDMARQRQLERAGWQFFRVRAGSFYRDRVAALEPLWRELARLEVWPKGAKDTGYERGGGSHGGEAGDSEADGSGEAGDSCAKRAQDSARSAREAEDEFPSPDVSGERPSGSVETNSRDDGEAGPGTERQRHLDYEEAPPQRAAPPRATARVLGFPPITAGTGRSEGPPRATAGAVPARDSDPRDDRAVPTRGGEDSPGSSEVNQTWSSIDLVPQDVLQGLVLSYASSPGRRLREELLQHVRERLGFAKLGKKIRKRINRCIGGLVRAGRLGTDWETLWITGNADAGPWTTPTQVLQDRDAPELGRARDVLAWYDSHPGWHSRAEVVGALRLNAVEWSQIIRHLVRSGSLERIGEKRGTRYRRP